MEPTLDTAATGDAAGGTTTETAVTAPTAEAVLVEQELLVEEISIDGMCGVY